MKTRTTLIALLAAATVAAAAIATPAPDQLRLFGIGALDPAFSRNLDEFKKATGNDVRATNGTATMIKDRLAAGESADVIVAPGDLLDDAAKAGKIVASTRTVVAKVGVGMVVRKDTTAPALKTPDALKDALLKADSVVYNTGSSGQYLDKLFEKMGVADKLKAKTTKFANGNQVGDHVVASKNNEIGFLPLTYIRNNEARIQFVGPLPGDAQNYTVYEAAVMTDCKAQDSAKALIKFLTSEAAKKTFAAAGVE